MVAPSEAEHTAAVPYQSGSEVVLEPEPVQETAQDMDILGSQGGTMVLAACSRWPMSSPSSSFYVWLMASVLVSRSLACC